jgi:hypothetical protein
LNIFNFKSPSLQQSQGWVDPTGEPEKALAEGFRAKAKKVENEGFQPLTDTLRDLADAYDKTAERIISESEKLTS